MYPALFLPAFGSGSLDDAGANAATEAVLKGVIYFLHQGAGIVASVKSHF